MIAVKASPLRCPNSNEFDASSIASSKIERTLFTSTLFFVLGGMSTSG
jgi:hypothetical protein